MRRVLSVLVENEPGVLSRVAGLFSGRGFNIESLNVAPTLEQGVSHMTITTRGDAQIIEQIIKQLRKLVTVIKVVDFEDTATVEREMVVFKLNAEESKRSEILRIVDIFRCKVVDLSPTEFTIAPCRSAPNNPGRTTRNATTGTGNLTFPVPVGMSDEPPLDKNGKKETLSGGRMQPQVTVSFAVAPRFYIFGGSS